MSAANCTQFRNVYLHGDLRRFGRHFTLAVATPAEAVRALCVQIKGLTEAIRDGVYRVVVGPPKARRARGEGELLVGFSHAIHIIPVVQGEGGKGLAIGLTIVGAVLLATAFAAPLLLGGGLLAGTSIFGVSAGTWGMIGASLLLKGISSLLAPKPDTNDAKNSESTSSFIFGGPSDRVVAGRPVRVTFGEYMVMGTPISVQLRNVRIA